MFNYKLTKDFALSEFFRTNQGLLYECELVACMCCVLRNIILKVSDSGPTNNIIRLAGFLQTFRNEFNQPIVITSGYRSASLNLRVSGAANSKHLRGLAADITFSGYTSYLKPNTRYGTPSKVVAMCDWLKKAKSDGRLSELIFHDTYIHIAI